MRMLSQTSKRQPNIRLVPSRKWEATRRVAFDADEEETAEALSEHSKSQEKTQWKATLNEIVDWNTGDSQQRHQCNPIQVRHQISYRPTEVLDNPKPLSQLQNSAQATPTSQHNPSEQVHATTECPISPKVDEPTTFNPDEWNICKPDLSPTWHDGDFGRWVKLASGYWYFRPFEKQHRRSKHPRNTVSKKPRTTFQTLPPEIRNTIYEYLVPTSTVLVRRTRPKKEERLRKKYWSEEHVSPPKPVSRLMHRLSVYEETGGFETALNLMRTCKQLRGEVEAILYSSTVFHFFTLKDLRKFLGTASRTGIESIRKASIRQDGYGHAQVTDNEEYHKRYYQKWEKACTKFGEMTPNLRHLKLSIHDKEWPCVPSGKDFNPSWSESIFKTAPTLLPKVEVRIFHKMLHQNPAVLQDLARRVEDNLMTEAGRKERDRLDTEEVMKQIAARKAMKANRERNRQAKLNAPPPRTELVISMDDIAKQNKAPIVKVRGKGLEKFGKINPSTSHFWVLN